MDSSGELHDEFAKVTTSNSRPREDIDSGFIDLTR